MTVIQQLSASVVNKIAAGEVIERPASVLKELMENAVDAGASRIDVAVEQGGLELVRVSDNGHGIAADELPLAVTSHATSKIRDADDLFHVRTLGFRGEALASIAEISRLVLRSRTPQASGGAEMEVVGGEPRDVAPCGCPVGTTVEVHHLFYNTPVRRKFLRSMQTEMGHVSEAFTRIALANPLVHCTLRHGGRTVYDLAPTDDWLPRLAALFGQELGDDLIAVESRDGDVALNGYVATPSHSRASARLQYLFLNGRSIRDRSLQHALSEAYRGLLLTGRYPIAFLRIAMPADMVDVNVHPTKAEVRFQEAGRLYSQLLGTLRTKFLSTDLTARGRAASESEASAAHDAPAAQRLREDLVAWAKGQLATAQSASQAAEACSPAGENYSPPQRPLELETLTQSWQPVAADWDDDEAELPAASAPPATGFTAHTASGPVAALQVHNRYLVTASAEGVIVIDQHALHERILYEQLRERVLAGSLESQNLLVPEPVNLSPAETAAALTHADLLARLGIRVEPFGRDTVLVSSYPAMLVGSAPQDLLRDVLDLVLEGGKLPERRDLLDDLMHMVACKAAIKAGDRLTPEEMTALIEQRHLAQDTHHCPHGRPTALVFTRDELDRQFKRT